MDEAAYSNERLNMKLLVTGGCGFIGSAVCRKAVQKLGYNVVNIDKLTYASSLGSTKDLNDTGLYRLIKADICDRANMRAIIESEQPDAIMHLAAESHVDRSIDNPLAFVETNVMGTASMLDAALSYFRSLDHNRAAKFRFHHISTDEVFGSLPIDSGIFTETTAYDPSSPYSASKAASDHLVRAYQRTYGLPAILTNCSNNYGPFHFPEKLIPLMIIKAIKKEALPVYGNGSNIRDWLYVTDHADALLKAIQFGVVGESYNIGGMNEVSNLDVVRMICDIVDEKMGDYGDRKQLIKFVADRPGHDLRYAIDCSKAQRELGWGPSVSFEEGLKKTVEWYLENSWWWEPLYFQKAESGKRLGLAKSNMMQVAAS
jgi:dTDP-glucose 4,6-dehydratase